MDRALDSAPAAPGSVSLLLRLRGLGMFRVLHVACSFPRRSTAGLLPEQLGQSLAVPCQGPARSFSFLVDSTEISALTLMKRSQTAFRALRRRAAHPAEATPHLRLPAGSRPRSHVSAPWRILLLSVPQVLTLPAASHLGAARASRRCLCARGRRRGAPPSSSATSTLLRHFGAKPAFRFAAMGCHIRG